VKAKCTIITNLEEIKQARTIGYDPPEQTHADVIAGLDLEKAYGYYHNQQIFNGQTRGCITILMDSGDSFNVQHSPSVAAALERRFSP